MNEDYDEAKHFEDQVNANHMYLGWEQSGSFGNPLEILIEIEIEIELNGEIL